MSNIRARIELVKETIDRLMTEKLDYSETKDLIDMARMEIKMIEYPLKRGDIDAPICCYSYSKKHEKEEIGCGKWTGKDNNKWVWNFYGDPDEFVKYCKVCRNEIRNDLPYLRKKLDEISKTQKK